MTSRGSTHEHDRKHGGKGRPDFLLWTSLVITVVLYIHHGWFPETAAETEWYNTLTSSVHELINIIWWGILVGFLTVSILSKIPREFVIATLGTHSGIKGIIRATIAGVLLDLCSHGILMVGAKLYERGVSIGQVMAFLISSPWNSFSLTLILIALIGLPWTLAFIGLSMLIAINVGMIFDKLVANNKLPSNPSNTDLPKDFRFWQEAKSHWKKAGFNMDFFLSMFKAGIKESRMVVRWILFGVILAGLVRAFVSPDQFGTFFGPTLAGLGLTIVVATILEVCSEGSTPIAADLLTRANAPGNSFAFLMTGVSTDYTEFMVLKEATGRWVIPLFLPLLTVPQVILVSWCINILYTG